MQYANRNIINYNMQIMYTLYTRGVKFGFVIFLTNIVVLIGLFHIMLSSL